MVVDNYCCLLMVIVFVDCDCCELLVYQIEPEPFSASHEMPSGGQDFGAAPLKPITAKNGSPPTNCLGHRKNKEQQQTTITTNKK